MKTLLGILGLSFLILIIVSTFIIVNRGSENINGLAIKVLSPLLVSLSLIIWSLYSNEKTNKDSFYTIGIYFKDDGFPVNLGSAYFTTHNSGYYQSALTAAYKNTNYKDHLLQLIEINHPKEEIEVNGEKVVRKAKEYLGRENFIGEYSINLMGFAFLNGFMSREFGNEWDKSNLRIKYLGKGMGLMKFNQKDIETNTKKIMNKDLGTALDIQLNPKAEYFSFVIPKDGNYEKVVKSKKKQFAEIEFNYKSPSIKEFKVKIEVERYGEIFYGKFADALEKEIELDSIFAVYYRFETSYNTNWYNRFSPKTIRETKWLDNKISLMRNYFSWEDIQDDLIFAIQNYNKEKNRFDIKAKVQKDRLPIATNVEIYNKDDSINVTIIPKEKE